MKKSTKDHISLNSSLVVAYQVNEAYACFVQENVPYSIVSLPREENQVAQKELPISAIRIVVGQEEHPSRIIFIGKPLLYLERLIELHAYFFPFHPFTFYKDSLNFLTTFFSIDSQIKKTISERQIKKSRLGCEILEAEFPRIPFYYVHLPDALAHALQSQTLKKHIYVCLIDDYNGPSFHHYFFNGTEHPQKYEEDRLLGFAYYCSVAHSLKFSNAIKSFAQYETRQWHFIKKNLIPDGLYLKPAKRNYIEEDLHIDSFCETFASFLNELAYERDSLFVSDFEVPEEIKAKFPSFIFVNVSKEEKIKAAISFIK